jgi:hypothetical protein
MEFLTKNSPNDGSEIVAKNWTSGNEIIDNFIQEKQLNYNENSTVFEWIPYNKFIEIKETDGKEGFVTAIWKEGPLRYNYDEYEWTREPYVRVYLRYLHNSQDITEEFINKVLNFSMNLMILI